jgi:hypothetical protein
VVRKSSQRQRLVGVVAVGAASDGCFTMFRPLLFIRGWYSQLVFDWQRAMYWIDGLQCMQFECVKAMIVQGKRISPNVWGIMLRVAILTGSADL